MCNREKERKRSGSEAIGFCELNNCGVLEELCHLDRENLAKFSIPPHGSGCSESVLNIAFRDL